MVREIRGTKINPKSSFKNWGAQNTRGRKLREQIRYLICFQEPSGKLYCIQLPLVQALDAGQESSADGHHAASHPCGHLLMQEKSKGIHFGFVGYDTT